MAIDLLANSKPTNLLQDKRPTDLLSRRKPVDLLDRSRPTDVFSEEKKPIFETGDPAAESILQASTQAVDSLLLGVPGFVAGQMGYEIPEPKTSAGKIGAGLGSLAGFIGGPAKIGAKVAGKVLGKATAKLALSPSVAKMVGNTLTRQAIGLGVASGLMTPKDSFFAPLERARQFGSGAVTGLAFGGMSYIPSRAGRMLTMAGATGIPSTLQEAPLEEQIFEYGLGAYFGIHGRSIKNEKKALEKLSETIKNGVGDKAFGKLLKESNDILDTIGLKREKDIARNIESAHPLTGRIKESRDPKTLAEKSKGVIHLGNRYLNSGYKLLQKLGGGDPYVGDKLSNAAFLDDTSRAVQANMSRKLLNNMKSMFGMSEPRSKDLFLFLHGRISKDKFVKKYGKRGKVVADMGRKFLDNQLGMVNDQLIRYGEQPIEARDNYAPLIRKFYRDAKTRERFAEKSGEAVNFEEIALYEEYLGLTPRERFTHGIKRRKHKIEDFKQNAWELFDIYAYRSAKAGNDNFVRQSRQYDTYLNKLQTKLQRHNKSLHQGEKLSEKDAYGFELTDVRRNLQQFVKDYQGHPSDFDRTVKKTTQSIDSWIGRMSQKKGFGILENVKLDNPHKIQNAMVGLMYTSQMGFRPKLAIRNLGQHSLIIGETGFKPLVKALTEKRTPEVLKLLSQSNVLSGRQGNAGPMMDVIGNLAQKGLYMFSKADRKNVVDSFLAGYYQAKGQGKSNADAIKRGDQVAGRTQFVYLAGNRSGLARGIGGRTMRPLSMFTSWPINYMEFIVQSARKDNRANLAKYLATSAGLITASAALGIKGVNYVGITSPLALASLPGGNIPLLGVLKNPRIQVFEDIKKTLNSEAGLLESLFYTLDVDPSDTNMQTLLKILGIKR